MIDKEERNKKIISYYLDGKSTVKIGKMFNMSAQGVYYILKKNNIKLRSNKENSRKYYYDFDFFENIDTEEKAYWLGFVYADGYIISTKYGQKTFGVTLSSVDFNHLEKLKKSLHSNAPIHTYTPSKKSINYSKNNYSRIVFSGEKIVNDLLSQGVVFNKTLILKPPCISEEFIPHFIRGYFDGDGCITSYFLLTHNKKCKTKRYKVSFVGTKELLLWIADNIKNFSGIDSSGLFKRHKNDKVYSLEYSSVKKSFYVMNYFYSDATIYLDRKYNKYTEMLSYIYSRRLLKRSPLKSLELSGKPLELAKLQYNNEINVSTNA